jgi:hypothetical protein
MTNAIQPLLADALTTVINAAVTAVELDTVGFTARRSYPDWDDDFGDLKALAVDVVFVSSGDSGGIPIELDSVGTVDTEPSIDIAVRKRFNTTSDREVGGRLKNSSVDALVRLVEQIHELFSGDRNTEITLASGLYANWVNTKVRTYCDYAKLRNGCFLGVVRVRYDVSKAG